MTGPVIAIIFHGFAALLLIGGGVYAIIFGYRLFLNKVGLTVDQGKMKLKFGGHEIEFSSSTVGGVLMMTACVWGGLGTWALPNYSDSVIKVSSLDSATKTLSFQPNKVTLAKDDKNAIHASLR
jgi:hypothetical protein